MATSINKTVVIDSDGDLVIDLTVSLDEFAPFLINDNSSDQVAPEEMEHDSESRTDNESQGSVESSAENQSDTATIVSFKVSAKHLTFASKRFKKMLAGPWLEANVIHPDGLRHVHIDSCLDPSALEIVLNIIHGRTSLMARVLELELLAKVAVVVDDLDVHDAVSACADHWTRYQWRKYYRFRVKSAFIAKQLTRNMILLLLVSVVFKHNNLLSVAARDIVFWSRGSVPTLGLPLYQTCISGPPM